MEITFPELHISRVCCEKGIPDHRSILLKESEVDGLIPFQFFHSWLDVDGFHDLVGDTWNNDGIVDMNGLTSFKKKLQNLKQDIRKWVASKKFDSQKLRKDHQHWLSSIDAKVDQGCAREEDIINRKHSSTFLGDLDRILKNDEWIEDPDHVKAEFLNHFSTRFQQPTRIPPSLDADSLTPFSPSQLLAWHRDCKKELMVFKVDFEKAVDSLRSRWIHVQVFTTLWDLLEDDVVRFVQEFFRTNTFPKGCNSSFIALIPKLSSAKFGRYIIDGPLFLNEVLAWHRDCKKELMVFKVDFEKAFDSLRLHAFTCKAGELCLFKGASIGRDNMNILHLMYADDGEREEELKCPYFVALQVAIGNVTLTHQSDSWKWSIDVPASFSVASVHALLDVHTLDLDPVATLVGIGDDKIFVDFIRLVSSEVWEGVPLMVPYVSYRNI
ncbi:hypothetical protein Tco_1033580 [Tanacetum coccineum]